ncbi:MAG: response regulator [Desulfovibrio sp.]|jgi:CheY-like chemotaxis protein/HPt (histidine-containing phosphotransfer) domain-containing protein|nr:response regulator [Desulfovibrio sp.]
MKRRVIIVSFTVAQLFLLLCVGFFRSSDVLFPLFALLLACAVLAHLFVELRLEGASSVAVDDVNPPLPGEAGSKESLAGPKDLEPQPADGGAEIQDDAARQVAATADGPQKHTSTVLVADDSEINRAILIEILGQSGLLAVEAEDGREAVDIVRKQDISLVLMDLEMPVMDGKEATAQIRGMGKLPQDVPIIAMTGHVSDSLRMDCLGLGMNDYLTKPVDVQELIVALRKWLPGGLPDEAGADPTTSGANVMDGAGQDVPINVDAGLAATGGNKKLYHNLLNRFVERYGHALSLLRELLEKESYTEAARLVHTIKGVAANLGMKRITELSKNMESSLPSVVPSESVLKQFEDAMREAIEYIASLQVTQKTVLAGDRRISQEDCAALREILENFPHKIERDWGGLRLELEKFAAILENTPVAEKFSALLASVDDFDLESVARNIAELQQGLDAGQ